MRPLAAAALVITPACVHTNQIVAKNEVTTHYPSGRPLGEMPLTQLNEEVMAGGALEDPAILSACTDHFKELSLGAMAACSSAAFRRFQAGVGTDYYPNTGPGDWWGWSTIANELNERIEAGNLDPSTANAVAETHSFLIPRNALGSMTKACKEGFENSSLRPVDLPAGSEEARAECASDGSFYYDDSFCIPPQVMGCFNYLKFSVGSARVREIIEADSSSQE